MAAKWRKVWKQKYISETMQISAILKEFHMRPVKTLTFSFDPYQPKTETLRYAYKLLSCNIISRPF